MSSLHGKHILVIDDAPDVRLLAKRILAEEGATVSEAASIDEGIVLLREQSPHLILLDLMIPEKSGFDFLTLRNSSEALRAVPVVVLSGKSDRDSIQKAGLLGANDYLLKPFRATLLIQKTRKALQLASFRSRALSTEDKDSEAFVSVPAEILKLNENGCEIESPIRFPPERDIRVKAKIFSELGMENLPMRTATSMGTYAGNGRYLGVIHFVGATQALVQNIRSWVKKV